MAADRLTRSDLTEFERADYDKLLAAWQFRRAKFEKALHVDKIDVMKFVQHAFAGEANFGAAGKAAGSFLAARKLHAVERGVVAVEQLDVVAGRTHHVEVAPHLGQAGLADPGGGQRRGHRLEQAPHLHEVEQRVSPCSSSTAPPRPPSSRSGCRLVT